MTRLLKADMKWLFGAKYEKLIRRIMALAIITASLYSSDIKVAVGAPVLMSGTAFVTVVSFAYILGSDETVDFIRSQFMLPEKSAQFHLSFAAAVCVDILMTRASILLCMYIAFGNSDPAGFIGFFCTFVLSSALSYLLFFRLEKKNTVHTGSTKLRHSFILYLIRYITAKGSYIVNTVIIWAIACMFGVTLGKQDPTLVPAGIAMCCLNTPLGVLISSDKTFVGKLRSLPGNAAGVFIPYGIFVLFANVTACGIYLAVCNFMVGAVSLNDLVFAAFAGFVAAVVTAVLEYRFPLTSWKTENDLMHHPRKYIVSGIVFILAVGYIFVKNMICANS